MFIRLITGAVCVLVASCNQDTSEQVNRLETPESSFEAARTSLQRRDLEGYFDALTDNAVRRTLSNSISICLGSFRPEIQKFGYKPSIGCHDVLDRHGWAGPKSYTEIASMESWDEAVNSIVEPRSMAADLERLHRENDSGSSFVWDYLDSVRLRDIEISGSTATATGESPSDMVQIRFEKDETGWRFETHYE